VKKTAVILLMLSLGPYLSVQAGPPPEKVFRPYFLSLQNKIPNTGLESPGGMIWGPDKKTLELRENTGAPDISTLRQLTFPDLFIALKQLKHTQKIDRHLLLASGRRAGLLSFPGQGGKPLVRLDLRWEFQLGSLAGPPLLVAGRLHRALALLLPGILVAGRPAGRPKPSSVGGRRIFSLRPARENTKGHGPGWGRGHCERPRTLSGRFSPRGPWRPS